MNNALDLTAPRIVELRQYLLQPSRRDDLIQLFDRELVETQEAVGMDVLGQFRDLDRPDYFVWLRRFNDMESRRESLAAFYGGPVWAQHSNAANSTMIDSDDVLLLRPLSADVELDVASPALRDRGAKESSTHTSSPPCEDSSSRSVPVRSGSTKPSRQRTPFHGFPFDRQMSTCGSAPLTQLIEMPPPGRHSTSCVRGRRSIESCAS